MHSFTKILGPILVASAMITCAHAQTPPVRQQLDTTLFKDGHQIAVGTSIIADEINGKAPFVVSSGTHVGYGTCTKVGDTTTLKSESVFVGRAIVISPVVVDATKAKLSVSVQDTEFVGKHEAGPSDCRSEIVDSKGLKVADINVDIADGQTVEVPLGDVHYRLVLKLHDVNL